MIMQISNPSALKTAGDQTHKLTLLKQQGIDDDLKVLQRDDFLLVIMTKQQLHMYEKFGGRILCMDSTHSTNSYSFKLIT
jgi:hypothetical protein